MMSDAIGNWSPKTKFRSSSTIQSVQTAAAAKATLAARTAAVNEARQNITVAETAIQQAQAQDRASRSSDSGRLDRAASRSP